MGQLSDIGLAFALTNFPLCTGSLSGTKAEQELASESPPMPQRV